MMTKASKMLDRIAHARTICPNCPNSPLKSWDSYKPINTPCPNCPNLSQPKITLGEAKKARVAGGYRIKSALQKLKGTTTAFTLRGETSAEYR